MAEESTMSIRFWRGRPGCHVEWAARCSRSFWARSCCSIFGLGRRRADRAQQADRGLDAVHQHLLGHRGDDGLLRVGGRHRRAPESGGDPCAGRPSALSVVARSRPTSPPSSSPPWSHRLSCSSRTTTRSPPSTAACVTSPASSARPASGRPIRSRSPRSPLRLRRTRRSARRC